MTRSVYLSTFLIVAALLAGCGQSQPEPVEPPTASTVFVSFQNPEDSGVEVMAYQVKAVGQEKTVNGVGTVRAGRRSMSINLADLGDADSYEVSYTFRPQADQPSCAKRSDDCRGSNTFSITDVNSGEPIMFKIPAG